MRRRTRIGATIGVVIGVTVGLWAALPATEPCGGGFPNASWTIQTGSFTNAAGECYGNTGGTYNRAWWNADSFANDQYAQAILTGTNLYPGVMCRATGTAGTTAGYVVYQDSPTLVQLYEIAANVETARASASHNATTSDVLRIECEGSDIRVYVNKGGSPGLLFTYTDPSPIASGSAGLAMYDNVSRLDDWEGGDLGGGPPAGGDHSLLLGVFR
jgi:hypothetical protein